MATKSRYAALFNPSDDYTVPMESDDEFPVISRISMAQVAENQCLSPEDIFEIMDREVWNK